MGASARATTAVHGATAAGALGSAVHGAVHAARTARATAARVRTATGAHHHHVLWTTVGSADTRAKATARAAARAGDLGPTGEGRHLLVHAGRAAVGALRTAALLRARAVCIAWRGEVLGRKLDSVGRENAWHGHCWGSGASCHGRRAELRVLLLQLLAPHLAALGQGDVPDGHMPHCQYEVVQQASVSTLAKMKASH
jgi:hypothetical protein